jgi:AraC-like DNA-binding protein
MRYGAQVPWQDLGVLAHVVLHSPTVGKALSNACRYLAVQQTMGRGALEVDADEARLVYTVVDPTIRTHAQHSEGLIAMCARICRDGTGDAQWAPRAVWFTHRAPRRTGEQEQFFRAPVRWERPYDALVLSAADLRRPFRTADPELLPALVRHAEEILAKRREVGFRATVRRLVAERLRAGEVTVEQVADRLGMSARSVQRRLQEDGVSFKALVDEVRLALSRRYLEDPAITLTEAAFLLGYSDLSAFSRAFRRWTGQSALEFRRRAT